MITENEQEQFLMSNTIQAVIWDLDGVIIDSADEHRQAWQRLAREEGVTFTDAAFWATFRKRNDDIIPAFGELDMHPAACVVIEDAVAGVQAAHAAGMRWIAVAGDRDLPGLREAELMVKSLTDVDVERIRALG